MRAISYAAPDELEMVDRPLPVPGAGEVLLEVAAVGICGTDMLIWGGGLARVKPPVTLGHEFSGTIVDANGQPGFANGDRVAVEPLLNCGECAPCRSGAYNVCLHLGLIGIDVDGAAASHVLVPTHRLHRIPDELSLVHAALTEPSAVALHMTNRSGLTASDSVLILGGGPIGALVACVARAKGVKHLVISEPNAARRALLEDLGFVTSDPTVQPLGELLDALPDDGFDITFELTGVPVALTTAVDATRIQGIILLGGLPHGPVPFAAAIAVSKELTLMSARVYLAQDVDDAIAMLADGSIPAEKLITRTVPLEEGIAGAFERLRDSRDDMKILLVPSKGA